MSAADASRAHPVVVRAVVTYIDTGYVIMWAQDRTSGIFFKLKEKRSTPLPAAGQAVEIRGVTQAGEFSPSIVETEMKILGPGWRIETPRPSVVEMMTGKYHSQQVEVEGRIHSGRIENGRLMLRVHAKDGKLKVTMEKFPPDWQQNLLHANVTLRGALSTSFNSRRQMIGVGMYVPLEGLQVMEPPEADPFTVELTPLGLLGQFKVGGRKAAASAPAAPWRQWRKAMQST